MSLKSDFKSQLPDIFFLDSQDLTSLDKYLRSGDRLGTNENILSVEKPGEGNMNYVLRIKTTERSFIIKQARPWVEKYPQIAAPVERSIVEASYLAGTQQQEALSIFSPKLLWSDPENFIFAQQDLGEAADFSFLYQEDQKMDSADLLRAVEYLKIVHQLPLSSFPANLKMRQLNHEHIFNFPFQRNNGLDLDNIQKGLNAVAAPFKENEKLKEKIKRLGDIYLSPGRSLIHGDFYPGSWLKTENGIMIIDPEFAFHGPPEFDLGVLFAHMFLAEQGLESLQNIWAAYDAPANFHQGLLSAFTGVEIMRRLIGIAQLPLSLNIAKKINLMAKASEWITRENLLNHPSLIV